MESTCWLGAQSIFLFLSLENLLTTLEETRGKLLRITSPLRESKWASAVLLLEGRRDEGADKPRGSGARFAAVRMQRGCRAGLPLTVLVISECLKTLRENTS